jgi:hypothetical protein
MRSTIVRGVLVVLAGFIAVTAIPGAIWVVPTMPLDWIKAGPFADWTVPAIALFGVGAVAAVTAALLVGRPWAGALASVGAGAVMVAFELVEVAVVGWTLSDPTLPDGFQKSLQVVYLVIGGAQVILGSALWLSVRRAAPAIWVIHPEPG